MPADAVSAQYDVPVMCHRTVHLNMVTFTNQRHLSKCPGPSHPQTLQAGEGLPCTSSVRPAP